MKNLGKITLISLAVFLLSLTTSIILFATGAKDFFMNNQSDIFKYLSIPKVFDNNLSVKFELDDSTIIESTRFNDEIESNKFNNVIVDIPVGEVTFDETDGHTLKVDYYIKSKTQSDNFPQIHLNCENGQLNITVDNYEKQAFNNYYPVVHITMPKSYKKDVAFTTQYSKTEFDNLSTNKLSINANASKIYFTKFNTLDIILDCNACDITMNDVDIRQSATFDFSATNIDTKTNFNCSILDIDAKASNVEIKKCAISDKLNCDLKSSNLEIDFSQCAKDTQINGKTSNVEIQLLNKYAVQNMNLDVKCTGDIKSELDLTNEVKSTGILKGLYTPNKDFSDSSSQPYTFNVDLDFGTFSIED